MLQGLRRGVAQSICCQLIDLQKPTQPSGLVSKG